MLPALRPSGACRYTVKPAARSVVSLLVSFSYVRPGSRRHSWPCHRRSKTVTTHGEHGPTDLERVLGVSAPTGQHEMTAWPLFGRQTTLHAAAYCAPVSSISAGQRRNEQVAGARDTVFGSEGWEVRIDLELSPTRSFNVRSARGALTARRRCITGPLQGLRT